MGDHKFLTFRTANQQAVQNLELRVNDLSNVQWRRLSRHEDSLTAHSTLIRL
jgi:hypothetical protein